MLVLTRKVGQSVQIGKDIIVTVCRVKGGYVRLGLDAPRDTKISRRKDDQDVDDTTGTR
jgi:carbon storage regulator